MEGVLMDTVLLGTGLLGEAIGLRLLQQGHRLTVWNRNPARCQTLVEAGAALAPTAAEAVTSGELVLTVLADGAATATVLQQAAGCLAGRLVVQMGTIAPSESLALAQQLKTQGCGYLEAPVLGSRPEALAGTLQVMVGGDADALARALPLLQALDPTPRYLGAVGAASHTKLALNQLIASLTHSFSLSLHLVQQAGVDVEAFMAILRGSALHAPTFDKKLAKELADDYSNPNFPTAHLRKDLNLFVDAARGLGLDTQGLSGLQSLLARASDAGIDALDYSALHRLTGALPNRIQPSASAMAVG